MQNTAGDSISFKFTSRDSTGVATALTSGTAAVYKAGSTTESTAGLTLTANYDSKTGLNDVTITTASDGTFYSNGSDFDVVLTAGTVNGVSVVNECVGHFRLESAPLKPTVAGRTLDVSSGGEAGVDWANIGSPTTTINLSATTIKTATDVETDTADIQSRLPSALISGRINASVGAMDSNVLTASAIATDAITAAKLAADVTTEIQTGLATATAVATLTTYVDSEVLAIKTVTDKLDSAMELDSTVYRFTTNALEQSPAGSAPSAATIADAVWDELQSGHVTAGTFGKYLDAAVSGVSTGGVSVGDIADAVWDEARAGHVTSGTFGAAIDTKLSDIEADPQNLQSRLPTSLVSGRIDASVGAMASNVITAAATASDYVTEISTTVSTALGAYGALKPTVSGRTLDVTASGEAGIDWSNIGSPTSIVNLSQTTIKTATDVETKVDLLNVSAGGGPIENTPVATDFTVTLTTRRSSESAGDKRFYVQSTEKVMAAIDFVNLLHAGDSLASISTITEGTGQSITLDPIGVCGTQAKFYIEDVLPNLIYRAECRVVTRFGLIMEGDVLIVAAD